MADNNDNLTEYGHSDNIEQLKSKYGTIDEDDAPEAAAPEFEPEEDVFSFDDVLFGGGKRRGEEDYSPEEDEFEEIVPAVTEAEPAEDLEPFEEELPPIGGIDIPDGEPEEEEVPLQEPPKTQPAVYDLGKFGGAASVIKLDAESDTSWLDSSIDNSIFSGDISETKEDLQKTKVVPLGGAAPVSEPLPEPEISAPEATESIKDIVSDSMFTQASTSGAAGISGGYIAPTDADSFTFDADSGMDFGPQDEAPAVPQAPVRHISPGAAPIPQAARRPGGKPAPVIEAEDFAGEYRPAHKQAPQRRKAPQKPKEKPRKEPVKSVKKAPSEEAPKKKSFLTRNFIIVKGDSVGNKIRKIIMCIAILAILISAGYLIYDYVITPYKTINQIQELNSMIGKSDAVIDDDKVSDLNKKYPGVEFPNGMLEKYASLYARNKDFVGWLTVDGLGISLPVVQGEDNSKYLKIDFDGKPNKYGSLFMNCSNQVQFLNRNTTIFGHDMKDIKMFGSLIEYKSVDGYKKAPVIEFNTIYGDYKWKVFAVFITNGTQAGDNGYLFNYMYTDLYSTDAFEEYLGEVKVRSIYYPEVDLALTDKILTLSTCTYEFNEARLVILARMVRTGEDPAVNVSNVRFNANPRYPAAYYAEKSLSNPYTSANKWYPS